MNAYIAEHQYGLPLEMRVLRYFPRAWTAEDSLLVGASMAEMLNHGTYLDDLNQEKILARLGPELTSDLYVESSQRDIVPGHDLDEVEPEAGAPDKAQEWQRSGDAAKAKTEEATGGKVSRFQGRARRRRFQGFKVSRFQS